MADLKAAAKWLKDSATDSYITDEQTGHLLLAAQALEALAWAANQKQPIECVLGKWRILGRDQYGHLKYYYADTPFGAILAAMEGERNA